MKTKTLLSLLVLALANTSTAQNALTPPIMNWTYYNHASTAGEGMLRGQANVVQAIGQTNYMNSVAAVNFAEAQRRYIENQRLYVKTTVENREQIREYRERYARQPISKEQWQEFSRKALPNRLTSQQYSNGKLVWPHILRMDEYTVLRKRIDELVAGLSPDDSSDGSPSQREIAATIDAMKILLRENMDSISSSQFCDSKWFLICLDYEMKQPLNSLPSAADNSQVPIESAPTQTIN